MRCKFMFNSYWWGVLASALAFPALLAWTGASGADNAGQTRPALEQRFAGTVRPFMQTYCVSCHGKEKPQAQLDLTSYANLESVARDYPHWSLVVEKLTAKQMPPANVGKRPSDKQNEAVIAWIRDVRQYEAQRNAGDPGPVLARRLSNAEYDYTIRDLTGVDLRPTREFPVDPANQEGFDNSGESLSLSPALMKKYVQAAKEIADHAVLTSTGLEFASHPVLAETDRDKYCILRIVDFYKRQPTDYADYFQAAWRYQHRGALGIPKATLQTVAAEAKVSPGYLELVWNTLNASAEKTGPLARLQALWSALPAPAKGNQDEVHSGCVAMRDWVLKLRKKTAWHFDNLRVPRGFSTGGQCFVLWKDREYASHRRLLNPDTLQIGGVPHTRVIPARRNRPEQTVTDPVDPDLFVPQDEAARAPYLAAFKRFCSVFPDAFYISERGRMFVDDPGDQGRLLTAGLHNSMGYFRDDVPLMELILDESGRRTLDHLWLDFDLVAFIPERMHLEFFHYERAESGTLNSPEFDFVRAEDKDATSDAKIKRLADAYLAKARKSLEENGGEPLALKAIEDHFKWVSTNIRATEKARLAAEPAHLKGLLDFARRAYRRPLTEAERSNLLAFYQSLRQKEGLGHEDAVRDTLISVLMSPNFLFRLDLEAAEATPLGPPAIGGKLAAMRAVRFGAPGDGRFLNHAAGPWKSARSSHAGGAEAEPFAGIRTVAARNISAPPKNSNSVQPLPDYALASRLSYFLWSSMPDQELLSHAAAGDLHRPEVLAAQARRMLRDPRVRALALEFGGNWLEFRRFEEHNAVDRERFPSFNDDLREAMFEEPVHFLMDEFQQDRSVLDLLYGKHTFVNAALARHYGMADVKPVGKEWVRVADADRYGRGGLLPMAVFLTQNSPGLRTSPVKRGHWVVSRVLGEVIPAPPPNVPELPSDESKMDLPVREVLAKHRQVPMCAACHARFDSFGLAFEGYGPVGGSRTADLAGRPVDTAVTYPGGTQGNGFEGLLTYIREHRQEGFVKNFDRKLLSYSLSRTLQLSDESLLDRMEARLIAQQYRFDSLVDTIVTSPQFLNKRNPKPEEAPELHSALQLPSKKGE